MAYSKRYGAGFVDKPTLTTPVDATFLNAVEAALLALFDANPASAGMVPVWTPAGTKYVPKLITNAEIDPAAAIAKSKLGALSIVDADVASAAAIAQSKLALSITNTQVDAAAAIAASKVVSVADGWQPISATLTYSSTDGHTFVVTTGGVDLTTLIGIGSRVKLTHAAATKYFIVTAINATTITLYGGNVSSLAATAITAPFFSLSKAPIGFPLDIASWTETFTDGTGRNQASPANGTWYNPGTTKLDVPIGAWMLEYTVEATSTAGSTDTQPGIVTTLATNSSAATDNDWTIVSSTNYTVSGSYVNIWRHLARKPVLVATKTPFYLLIQNGSATAAASIGFYANGGNEPTIIRAMCAYL